MNAVVVMTTVGTEEQANLLARELVARRHAACVNIVPGLRSVYRWKGKISRDSEFLLIVKTLESEYPQVAATIHELHSYELPEVVCFKAGEGDPRFVEWIASCLDKSLLAEDEDDDDFPEDEEAAEDEAEEEGDEDETSADR